MTSCSTQFTITITDSFKLQGSSSWSHIHGCSVNNCKTVFCIIQLSHKGPLIALIIRSLETAICHISRFDSLKILHSWYYKKKPSSKNCQLFETLQPSDAITIIMIMTKNQGKFIIIFVVQKQNSDLARFCGYTGGTCCCWWHHTVPAVHFLHLHLWEGKQQRYRHWRILWQVKWPRSQHKKLSIWLTPSIHFDCTLVSSICVQQFWFLAAEWARIVS